MNRLVIELLSVEKGKAYGYQEYIFNLLNYFYLHKESIKSKEILILCKESERGLFEKYADKFQILGYSYNSYLKRYWLESVLPLKLKLGRGDILFRTGNYSGWIKKCSEILVIHDLLFKRKEWIPSNIMRWQREIYLPHSVKSADKIVAISNFTKEDVEHYYPNAIGKVEVIYNSFNFRKYDEISSFEKLNFSYFLTIANSADYKNLKTVLKAFSSYCKDGGDKNLVYVGKIMQESEAGREYEKLPVEVQSRIISKRNISNAELGSLYKNAACYISASKFEGLGMPVVEAMSFGVPVLLSDIPPHREVSLGKGDYFECEDAITLARKMRSLCVDHYDYGQEIREIFSEQNTSARYISLINKLTERIGTDRED